MKRLAFVLLALTACGEVGGSDYRFTVRVRDSGGAAVEGATVLLDMEESNSDEVCKLSPASGITNLEWNDCEFGALRCDSTPYAVIVGKSGYVTMTRTLGFSSSTTVDVTLEPCVGECDPPPACD